jgi:hypothetical protein
LTAEPGGRRGRFVAESFWPRPAPDEIRAAAQRVRRAAALLPWEVGPVRLVRCTLAPSDELCAWLFEAESEDAVRALGRAAGLDFERIGLAVDVWPARSRAADD